MKARLIEFAPGIVRGKLSYTGQRRSRGRYLEWEAVCACGTIKWVETSNAGRTGSCGCSRKRTTGTPEYHAWESMKQRCGNPNNPRYPDYGGRGIRVCDRWRKFRLFLEDMGLRPSPGHSIDRIDNDRGYEPGNVRWATLDVQARNKRPRRRRSKA